MDNKFNIKPAAMSLINWGHYILDCENQFGINPSRGLDTNGISLDDPASFVASLMFDNEPLKALRSDPNSRIFEHGFLSFYGFSKSIEVVHELNWCNNVATYKAANDGMYYFILSGTIKQWHQAIVTGTNSNADVRNVMCNCLLYIEQTCYREIFKRYSKRYLKDGTFSLS